MRRPAHPLHAHDLAHPVGTHYLDGAEEAIRLLCNPQGQRSVGPTLQGGNGPGVGVTEIGFSPMPKRRSKHPRFDSSDDLSSAPLAGRIDLHRLSVDQAEVVVRNFIDTWRRREPGAVVLIITGKGKGSADGPVLRPAIQTLLKTRLSGFVAEWALDDSEGAFRVRVR